MKGKYIYSFILTSIVFIFLFYTADAQQNLSGTYTMSADQTTLTLILNQSGNKVTGTLTSTTGASFQLEGEVMEGVGTGVCTGDGTSVYFEAFTDGAELNLGLIERDQFNMPDYNRAQYLLFTRQAGQGSQQGQTGNITGQLFGNQQQSNQQNNNQQNDNQDQQQWNQQGISGQSTGSSNITGNEVGDPSWGFKFVPPAGWVHQKSGGGAILGHNSIAGMILILPHNSENIQKMQQQLMQGIQEEGNYLTLSGGLNQVNQNTLSGDYTGVMDGTQVKAKGIGILSPYGGGAYLIAVSTPDKFGNELISAVESISRNMQYFKIEVSDLMQHFAGNWSTFTTNTSTWMCFCPDGTYSEQYEAAYSGQITDGLGDVTSNWGVGNQSNSQGRWTVRGSKESGQIIVSLNDGREIIYEYRVHQEGGNTYYNEYWFNGSLYGKQ